jgi:prevent-host-death family protein
MAIKMNIHEAKTNFSKLVEAALAGEEVIIAKSGTPILQLLKLEEGNLKLRNGFGAGRRFFDGMSEADMDELIRVIDEPVQWEYRNLEL